MKKSALNDTAWGRRFLVLVLAFICCTQAGSQQLYPVLNDGTAKKIVEGCEEFARKNDLNVAIAVTGPGEILKAFLLMDGAVSGAGDVAIWKARSSSLLGLSTGKQAKLAEESPAITSIPGVAAVEGGEALYTITGALIGGVGVSGGTASQDAECARAGIVAAGQKYKDAGGNSD